MPLRCVVLRYTRAWSCSRYSDIDGRCRCCLYQFYLWSLHYRHHHHHLLHHHHCDNFCRLQLPKPDLAICGVSIRLSVTRSYWLKTNNRRITGFLPGSTGTTDCYTIGARRDWGGKTGKNEEFRPINRYISKTMKDRHILLTMED